MEGKPLRTIKREITDGAANLISRVEELAYELTIGEVMTRDIQSIPPGTKMGDVMELFRQVRISGAPVVANGDGTPGSGDLIGIVSLEDLIRALREGNIQAPVGEYMTRQVLTVQEAHPLIEALKVFEQKRIGRLPVLNANGKLAGIITKGDISSGLMHSLQYDYQEEEVRKYRARHLFEDIESDRTSLTLRYKVAHGAFATGGNASSHIKRALLRLGANPQIARRCGIAIYEAEMNLIIHTTHGGMIRVEIEPNQILMETIDDGPGIADIELAMTPGYSTAPDSIRELGFGAGMGLKNIERCVDNMYLDSSPGRGTRLEMRIYMQSEELLGEAKGKN